MKVLFFGTPNIAVPFLEWLDQHHTVVGVVCQPDKPSGRGYEIQPPPTKVFAEQKGIPVFQPAGKWEESTTHQLLKTGADIGVAVAYGRIMPESILQAARLGTVNIHFSLLPKYRGAAPMQWAIVNGEKETGVSVFWLVKEMDAGPLFHQAAIPIQPEDDARTIESKLIPLGISVLAKCFSDLEANQIVKTPQQGTPTFAHLIRKEDGRIDWRKPADSIVNLVRGFCEWPVAYTEASGKRFKIYKAAVVDKKGDAGRVLSASEKEGICVAAGEKAVSISTIQPEGKKPMSAWSFWQGGHLKVGDIFQ